MLNGKFSLMQLSEEGRVRILCVLCLALFNYSCSTIKTLDPIYNQVEISYQGHKSYCKGIPRIYSGVSYNACLLYGEPNPNGSMGSINGVPTFIIDSALSLAADTVVLPYTIYTQVNNGNIKVN